MTPTKATAKPHQINFRVTAEEYDAFSEAADEAGLSLSEWLRLVARAGAGMRALEGHLRRAASKGTRA